MAIMVFVSRNEKDFHACPSMSHVVAAEGTHAVAGEGSHAVTGDQRVRMCAAAAARRARRRGPGPPRTAPRVPHAGGEKKLQSFDAPSRDSPSLS